MVSCFHKSGFRKERPDIQVLDQEEEEFVSLVKELSCDVSPLDYIDYDMEVAMAQFPVDVNCIA